MIVLHYPYANQLKMVMKGGQFALPNNRLPSKVNMKEFLDGHSDRSDELEECIKKHKKKGFLRQTLEKAFVKKLLETKINLMAIYEKILHYFGRNDILAVSEDLRGKFRKFAILLKFLQKNYT
jgi:hypothetical protein